MKVGSISFRSRKQVNIGLMILIQIREFLIMILFCDKAPKIAAKFCPRCAQKNPVCRDEIYVLPQSVYDDCFQITYENLRLHQYSREWVNLYYPYGILIRT